MASTNRLNQLVVAAKAGDERAFEKLFYQHFGVVWGLYPQVNRHLNKSEWEQECRIQLLNCLRAHEDTRLPSFSSYFKRACENRSINLRKRHWLANDQVTLVSDPSLAEEHVAVYIDDQAAELSTSYNGAFSRLSDRDQQILAMVSQGYTSEEVGWQLGVRQPTARNWINKARTRMRRRL